MAEPILFQTGPLRVNTLVVPVSKSEAFVVDPANCRFSRDEEGIFHLLSEKGLKPIAVVLTHGHFDHVSGLPAFRARFSDIPIAIHEDDAHLLGEKSADGQGRSLSLMGFPEFIPFVSGLPEPSSFLRGGESLSRAFPDISGEAQSSLSKWRVLHTPGHTQGSVCLLNADDNLLISGDTVFFRSWGRTDLPGGSERQIQESLRRISESVAGGTRVFSGHDSAPFILSENW